ncbi:MAG: hypothetical protein J7K36_11095 [Archaeoglobaceae archaeon]|nr:hypothetical protein [Archaeoglobaceae archaeon]
MRKEFIIAKKEIMEILQNKSSLLFTVGYSVFFSVMAALGVKKFPETIDTAVFYIPLVMGIFFAYVSTGRIFFREKRDKIIETLLCTPVSLRKLWFGKVLGAAIPSYAIAIFSAFLIALISSILLKSIIFPSLILVLHLLVTIPLFVLAAVGLIGFLYLLAGMKEVRIAGTVIFMTIFGALFGGLGLIGEGYRISLLIEIALMMTSLLLVVLTGYLTRYLSKERIVTTIT